MSVDSFSDSDDDSDKLEERTSFYSRSFNGSPVNFDELAELEANGYENSRYQCHLRDILHCRRLPPKVDLGNYNRVDGHRPDYECFLPMKKEELALLARQLLRDKTRDADTGEMQPNVTCLHLSNNRFGPDGMRLLVGPIGTLSGLRILNLHGICTIS